MKFCMGKQAFVETAKWGLLKPEIIFISTKYDVFIVLCDT